MKKTFLVEIDDGESPFRPVSEVTSGEIINLLYCGSSLEMPMISVRELNVEQNCGTPENTSENSKKPLRLSGNIAWENRIEEWR
jgi:hypothetical protein